MAIQRKPKSVPAVAAPAAVDAFVGGAPDARPAEPSSQGIYEKGIPKGHKRQISLTIAPDLLRKVDEIAERTGQARAAVINLAIFRALEGDFFK